MIFATFSGIIHDTKAKNFEHKLVSTHFTTFTQPISNGTRNHRPAVKPTTTNTSDVVTQSTNEQQPITQPAWFVNHWNVQPTHNQQVNPVNPTLQIPDVINDPKLSESSSDSESKTLKFREIFYLKLCHMFSYSFKQVNLHLCVCFCSFRPFLDFTKSEVMWRPSSHITHYNVCY